MNIDYQAAWDLYYLLADRRHKEGLVFDEVKQIVQAAVKSATPMHYCPDHGAGMTDGSDCWGAGLNGIDWCLGIRKGVFIPIEEV